jgi:GTP pyrophosphokinase
MSEALRFKSADEIYKGRLRGNQLMLSGLKIGPGEARLLWGSANMAEITWLDLDDNFLGDEGVAELAVCPHLSNLQYLNLNKNRITDAGLIKLAQSAFLGKLKRLHLKDNPVRGEGILALFDSATLEELSIFQVHEGWSCKKREGWRYKSREKA